MFRRRKPRANKSDLTAVGARPPELSEVPPASMEARSVAPSGRSEGGRVIRYASLKLDGRAMGEYIVVAPEGRAIVTACGLPEPWSLEERPYTAYSCYLEEPGSGNRIRMDMVRAGDRDWVAVRQFSVDLEGYSRACVFPSGDGAAGTAMLTGEFTAV